MTKLSSRVAYSNLLTSGRANTLRGRVLKAVINRGITGVTRQEIVAETGIPINSVCGRVKELLDDELIRVGSHPVKCAVTGNQVEALYLEHGEHE